MAAQPYGNGQALAALATPVRNRYFYGKLLDAFHFDLEQSYMNRKRWLINRLVLGSGVVVGLRVAVTNDGQHIVVGPGMALDGVGREIVVPVTSAVVDPHQLTDDCGRPDGNPVGDTTVAIYLAYHEWEAEYVPSLAGSCDSQTTCAPSSVCECYSILVKPAGSDRPAVPGCDFTDLFTSSAADRQAQLAERISQSPVTADGDVAVMLAWVNVPGVQGQPVTVDETVRTLVYSNELLLEMVLCLAERVAQIGDGMGASLKTVRVVSGEVAAAPAGSDLGPLTVQVLQGGAPLAGENVSFLVTRGNGSIGASAASLGTMFTATSGGDGKAELTLWRLGDAGLNEVTVSIGTGSPAETDFFRVLATAQTAQRTRR